MQNLRYQEIEKFYTYVGVSMCCCCNCIILFVFILISTLRNGNEQSAKAASLVNFILGCTLLIYWKKYQYHHYF